MTTNSLLSLLGSEIHSINNNENNNKINSYQINKSIDILCNDVDESLQKHKKQLDTLSELHSNKFEIIEILDSEENDIFISNNLNNSKEKEEIKEIKEEKKSNGITTNRFIKLTKQQKELLGTSMTETPEEQRKRKKNEQPSITLDHFFKKKISIENNENESKSIKQISFQNEERKRNGNLNGISKRNEKKEMKEKTKNVIPYFKPISSHSNNNNNFNDDDDEIDLEPSEFEGSMKHLQLTKKNSLPKMKMNTLK